MSRNLLIIGAGIYGLVAKEIAESMGCFEKIAFVDDGAKVTPDGTPVIGTSNDLTALAGAYSDAVVAIGMGIGTLIVPTLTDKFCPDNRLWASVVSGIVATVCVVGVAFLDPNNGVQFALMLICLFFAGFFIYAINGTVWAYAADVGGRVFASTASGILDFAAYMGAAIQAAVYGFILDAGNWNAVFLSIAVFCLLIAIVSLASTRQKKA